MHVEGVREEHSTPRVHEVSEDGVPVGPSDPISDSPPPGWVRGKSGKLHMVGLAHEKAPIFDNSNAQDLDASNCENGSRGPGKHRRSRESSTSYNSCSDLRNACLRAISSACISFFLACLAIRSHFFSVDNLHAA